MTTTTKTTALDRFIAKTRELFGRESDPEKRWTELSPILSELLADPNTVAASKKWPDCHVVDNRAENLLFYEDPDYKFVINGLVVDRTGYETIARIHDHAHIYTLYGLLDGTQRIERYERLDDGTKPDYAEIRNTFNSVCGAGEVDLVRPYEIHAEDTTGERAVAIIIRSEKSGEFLQGRYLPEKNGYWQGYGPRQTPIPFYGG
jgi:hypothetical protein